MERSDEAEAVERSLGGLLDRHLSEAYLRACDEEHRYPDEVMAALAEAGWAALPVPADHGGSQAGAADLALVHMVLARRSLAVAQAYFSLWVLGARLFTALGSPAQRERWLPALAAGRARIAFALTEPGSGSDAAALEASATRRGRGWSLRGQKVFTTGAAVADATVVVARTSRGRRPQEGLSLFVVEAGAPGLDVRTLPKMGLRALDLCEVFLDEVPLGPDALLGPEGGAWPALRAGLAAERLFLAAICVGALDDLVARTAAHARDRHAFGRPIGDFQMVGQKVVDMRVAAEAARLLTFSAAEAVERGVGAEVAAAMAKLHASEAYVSATREAVQVFGGYGFTEELPVARHYRDAKYMEIGGGSSEIQRIIIGRDLGLMK